MAKDNPFDQLYHYVKKTDVPTLDDFAREAGISVKEANALYFTFRQRFHILGMAIGHKIRISKEKLNESNNDSGDTPQTGNIERPGIET